MLFGRRGAIRVFMVSCLATVFLLYVTTTEYERFLSRRTISQEELEYIQQLRRTDSADDLQSLMQQAAMAEIKMSKRQLMAPEKTVYEAVPNNDPANSNFFINNPPVLPKEENKYPDQKELQNLIQERVKKQQDKQIVSLNESEADVKQDILELNEFSDRHVLLVKNDDKSGLFKARIVPDKNDSSPCVTLSFIHNDSRPVYGLASFPGSGNTWTRHLMQQITGHYTGSVYYSDLNVRDGWLGEGIINNTVVAVKTHLYGKKNKLRVDKLVLLTRNPYDALLAEFNRQHIGPVGRVPDSVFQSEIWKKFVETQSKIWRDFHLYWLNFQGPVYVLNYENWKKDMVTEMRRLSDFLGFPCSKERLSCVVRNQEGNYHRPPVKSDINRYPGSLHFTVQEAIQAVRDELKSRSESDLETVANLDQ